MKKSLILALFVVLSANIYAKTQYISGVQKVTFRTGPGTDNKIIKMLATDGKVTLLEAGETWSKVKDGEGNEGYVLNRFLTVEVPAINKFNYIKRKHDKLLDKQKSVVAENKTLKEVVAELKTKITNLEKNLTDTNSSFEELKTGSADYIGLKNKFEKTTKKLEGKTKRVSELEGQINVHYIKWFLAGGGVLLLGWIIGLISRKKKSYSGLRL